MNSNDPHRTLTRLARLAATVVAAAAPAAAIAAEPARAPAGKKGPNAPIVVTKTAPLAKQAAKAEKRQRKVHPVDGKVGYGDALAAFGHARGRPHNGQDVFAPAGTKLVATTDSVVLEAGSDGGRGNWVALYDRKRDRTYAYFHMLGPAEVEVGEKLRAGERVGEVGCTGSCWGDHLHFEIREGRGSAGTARNPMPFLEDADRLRD